MSKKYHLNLLPIWEKFNCNYITELYSTDNFLTGIFDNQQMFFGFILEKFESNLLETVYFSFATHFQIHKLRCKCFTSVNITKSPRCTFLLNLSQRSLQPLGGICILYKNTSMGFRDGSKLIHKNLFYRLHNIL